MRHFLISILIISLLFTVTLVSFLPASDFSLATGGFSESFPGPDLFYPVSDNISLGGNPYLEFKWRRTSFGSTGSYDFRLYKGYQTTAANLIMKKRLSIEDYPFKVASRDLELNQVYTWVLVQILNSGKKSDKSFSSFKIIKK